MRDFDLAEEALQDAYAQALRRWPTDGLPRNPAAWITRAARNRAIDRVRRRGRWRDKEPVLAALRALEDEERRTREEPPELPDERLRLIFTCCHPALAPEAQVALTLRTLCGLTTQEIARAFLVPVPTLAQRLVRAKKKIAAAGIPYRVPPAELLPERLQSVLAVIYLVFNEGYDASSGDAVVRRDLCIEAIRLGRLLDELLPGDTDVLGLLALMLLHDSRRAAREREGEPVLLDEQDRTAWDHAQIAEGLTLVERALRAPRVGPYAVQAAIAALHARAPTADTTDWRQIAALYGLLLQMAPSPVVRLNAAVAVALGGAPELALERIDALVAGGALPDYAPLAAARAELLLRLGRPDEARAEYLRAAALAPNPGHQRLMERKAAELG